MTMTVSAEREYALGYQQGRDAGRDYPFDDDFRTLFAEGLVRKPYYLGWARGFRHAIMERAS